MLWVLPTQKCKRLPELPAFNSLIQEGNNMKPPGVIPIVKSSCTFYPHKSNELIGFAAVFEKSSIFSLFYQTIRKLANG